MATRYYRIQPTGASLDWTSQGSETPLRPGYVFAYRSQAELLAGLHAWGLLDNPETSEVVAFSGQNAYDPGDYEGVAVKPGREVQRTKLSEWLDRHEPGWRARLVCAYGA